MKKEKKAIRQVRGQKIKERAKMEHSENRYINGTEHNVI